MNIVGLDGTKVAKKEEPRTFDLALRPFGEGFEPEIIQEKGFLRVSADFVCIVKSGEDKSDVLAMIPVENILYIREAVEE